MLPPAAPLAYTLFVGVDIAAKTATAAWTMDGCSGYIAHPAPFRPQVRDYAAHRYE